MIVFSSSPYIIERTIMLNEDALETQESISRINKVCKLINVVFKVILVIFCAYWVVAIVGMIFGAANNDSSQQLAGTIFFQILLFSTHGVVIAFLIGVLIAIFSDASKGESPFTFIQVKRLRWIAGLLLIYAVLDFLITQNNALLSNALLSYSGMDSGYISTSDISIIQVNLGPLIAAGAVYAFSFVFKYGVLLQEFSDETL